MTLFEYLAIAFSLVLSFTAMRLLAGLSFAARRDRRYWVHLAFVCGHLLATVGVFWNFWSFREATWTFSRFALVLANPALIYFNACTLVPENAPEVESWRDYYYAVRRRYFLGIAAWALVIAADVTLVLQMPWSHPARVVQAAWLAIGIGGAMSSSERVHAGIVVGSIGFGLAITATLFMQPGALAP